MEVLFSKWDHMPWKHFKNPLEQWTIFVYRVYTVSCKAEKLGMSLNVVVCGGGNGAHVAAGLFSSRPNTEVRVLTLYADEAERWTKALEGREFLLTGKEMDGKEISIKSKPKLITKDPKEAVKHAHLVIFIVPAFAHDQYFSAIKDHVDEGTIIVGLPSAPGFEFAARGLLGKKEKTCTLIVFETLPWACRMQEFGRHAHVIGFKEVMDGSMHEGSVKPKYKPLETMQMLMGPHPALKLSGHLLGCTLVGNDLHPSILYARWHDWDGQPVAEPPLFYQGVDDEGAKIIAAVSEEIYHIRLAINKKKPDVDLSIVVPLFDWLKKAYATQIKDKTSMRTAFNSNAAYEGLTHPTKKTSDGKYVPDFQHRYLSEDLPFAVVVFKGVAEIVGVDTPTMDMVLEWSQRQLGKEYIVNGKLTGKHVSESRAPQKYGLKTLDEILG